jgi:hypothetical protein
VAAPFSDLAEIVADEQLTEQQLAETVSLRAAIRHELKGHASLKKNGETWWQYAGKIITPERVILVVIAVFTFGGDIRDARRDLKTSVDQAMQASQKADVATKQAESAMAELLMARDELRQVLDATTKQQAFNADVTDRVSRSVTRSEFKSAIEQRVLPRLERIEKALQEAAK